MIRETHQVVMDTYQIGDFVRRWGQYFNRFGQPDDPAIAACHIITPDNCVSIQTSRSGNMVKHEHGVYSVDMVASRPGEYGVRWLWTDSLIVLPDLTEYFVVEEPVDTLPKTFPRLIDGDLTLVPLNSEHLELLRHWRNRDDIRQWFFNSDVISEQQQLTWYYSTYLKDAGDLMWIAHLEGQPVGTGALTNVDLDKREAVWARLIIGEERCVGKGLAARIARLIRDYGLDQLVLNRIYGSLYSSNERVLHVHQATGYRVYKIEGDITHVELWRKDWR